MSGEAPDVGLSERVVLDLDDPYFDGQTLPDALSDYAHVHSTTGVCVKNIHGLFCGDTALAEQVARAEAALAEVEARCNVELDHPTYLHVLRIVAEVRAALAARPAGGEGR